MRLDYGVLTPFSTIFQLSSHWQKFSHKVVSSATRHVILHELSFLMVSKTLTFVSRWCRGPFQSIWNVNKNQKLIPSKCPQKLHFSPSSGNFWTFLSIRRMICYKDPILVQSGHLLIEMNLFLPWYAKNIAEILLI
jgi:hypothetical protein